MCTLYKCMHCTFIYRAMHIAKRHVGHRGISCSGFEVKGNVSSLLLPSVLVIYYCATSHPKPAM